MQRSTHSSTCCANLLTFALHRHSHIDDQSDDEDQDCCRICRGSAPPLFYPCKCSGSIKYVHQQCLMDWLGHSGNTHCEVRRPLLLAGQGDQGAILLQQENVYGCPMLQQRARCFACNDLSYALHSPLMNTVQRTRSISLHSNCIMFSASSMPVTYYGPSLAAVVVHMLMPACRFALQLCKHEFVFTPVYAKDAPTRLPWAELLTGLIKRAVGGVRVAHRVWVVALVWLIFVPWITCLAWRLAFVRSLDDVSRLLRERWNVLAIATDCIQVGRSGHVK